MRPGLLRHPLESPVDPVEAFRRLAATESDLFFLDGAGAGRAYLGTGTPVALESGAVLPGLRAVLARPGLAAVVGWVEYEARGETTGAAVPQLPAAPAAFLAVERLLEIDEVTGEAALLAAADEWSGDLAAWRDRMADLLSDAAPSHPDADAGVPSRTAGAEASPPRVVAEWEDDRAAYEAKVRACQEAIREGEAYQLCLTTRVRVDGPVDPVATYLRLRETTPAHHGGVIRIGDRALLSASPERFLVMADGVVRTSPIKGTRPRDADPTRDAELAAELRASDKEQAENLMIVDLMRTDLSRVCEVGTVEVSRLLAVESYPAVHQLVSDIEGRIADGLDLVDVLGACFPAGSMTGAPKRRATEILDGLERSPRGVYSGTFGYLTPDGRADLAMVIRSIVVEPGGATVGAGGGITALSVPDEEYDEMRLKARAPLAALGALDD